MQRLGWAVCIATVIVLGGCGDEGPLGICSDLGVPYTCVEQDGDEDTVRDACADLNGKFEKGKECPSTHRVGGCRFDMVGFTETWWFYVGAGRDTEAEIREYCEIFGAEYLEPE